MSSKDPHPRFSLCLSLSFSVWRRDVHVLERTHSSATHSLSDFGLGAGGEGPKSKPSLAPSISTRSTSKSGSQRGCVAPTGLRLPPRHLSNGPTGAPAHHGAATVVSSGSHCEEAMAIFTLAKKTSLQNTHVDAHFHCR